MWIVTVVKETELIWYTISLKIRGIWGAGWSEKWSLGSRVRISIKVIEKENQNLQRLKNNQKLTLAFLERRKIKYRNAYLHTHTHTHTYVYMCAYT